MSRKLLTPLIAVLLIASVFAMPVAAQPADPVDECVNADEGPGANGPPQFVGSLLPDFLSELFSSLPVPDFVKALFGAETC